MKLPDSDTRVKEINGLRVTMELLDYNIGDTYVGKFGKEVKITHIYRTIYDASTNLKYFDIVYSFSKKKITLPKKNLIVIFFR